MGPVLRASASRQDDGDVWHRPSVIARAVLLILSVLLAGCTAGTEHSISPVSTGPPTPIAQTIPATCPKTITAGMLAKNAEPGITHQLVPGDPQTVVICVTSSFHPSDYPKRIVPGGDSASLFARELNLGLNLVPAGTVSSCPISYGPPLDAGLFFNYPDGGVLVVKVDDCPAATNGRRFAQVGAGEIWRLINLAQHPPTPGPSDGPAPATPSATQTRSVT